MNRISLTLQRFPVAAFCVLAVALSFAAYLAPIPRTGLPFVLVAIPAAVALALAAATEGRRGVRSLLGRLTPRRLGGIRWLIGALALALAMRLAVGLIAQMMGLIPAVPLRPENVPQTASLAATYVVAALLEELGWRGFALSRLLSRLSPAAAGLLLGVPWGLIHIVLHLPGMWSEGLPWLPTVVQLVALSVVLTWLFVRSGQSVLLVTLFHAAQSAFGFVNAGITPLHTSWLMAAVWGATAVLALVSLLGRLQPPAPAGHVDGETGLAVFPAPEETVGRQ